ncbi:hypothetical protein L596_013045 [Steinernema carpocapsae]|uniref:Uncharacterized protein n=1 Tax=Steinernema carpocapsae TaxID=34508 RepID=A0A4U5NZH4_STECR|nr:hypothetical protein L596_013045 [Steinernema carpocapsae]
MPAYILLVACVGISVALVGVLCVYCIMHCWQLKKPVTAGSKKRRLHGAVFRSTCSDSTRQKPPTSN